MKRKALSLITLLVLLVIASSSLALAAQEAPDAWRAKVDPWVLDTASEGETEFIVFLSQQANVSGAEALTSKVEKGRFVFEALTQTADATQGPVLKALQAAGVEYRPYWITNMIWVRGGLGAVEAMARRSDVAHVYANPTVHIDEPVSKGDSAAPASPSAIEWNITKVNAPSVWAAGYTGQGVVVAGQDTGYQWDHPALKGKYRGWDGSTASHDYNWHDAIHSGGGTCGANSLFPCDDHGHGTHTMGTMVGDDGLTNQIGMAPGAKWIGCRNMDQGNGTPATYSECYQFFLAPTTVAGTNPDPSKAPDVINNSWGCPVERGMHRSQRDVDRRQQRARGRHRDRAQRRQQRLGLQHDQRALCHLRLIHHGGRHHQHRRHRQLQQPRPGHHRRQQPAQARHLGAGLQHPLECTRQRLTRAAGAAPAWPARTLPAWWRC